MAASDEADFPSYINQITNSALIAHGVGLGANLKLFDAVASLGKPATSEEIANAGNFKERYVREWLALMVVGKIVEYNTENKTYFIPQQRLQYLTKQGKEKNLAVFLSGISIATGVSSELEQCFKKDGPRGVPYSSYKGFHGWRSDRVEARFQWHIMEDIFKLVPNLIEKLQKGITVCDAGCSGGHQVLRMAEHYPQSSFLGFDIDQDILDTDTEEASQRGLKNISFVFQDGCNMPSDWSNKFDVLLVWDVVHDVPFSKRFLQEINRVIKPGGIFFMMDIKAHSDLGDNLDHSGAPTLYGLSLFHCMSVSLNHEGGEGLGTCWGVEKQREYLQNAGFVDIKLLDVKSDNSHSYFIGYKKS